MNWKNIGDKNIEWGLDILKKMSMADILKCKINQTKSIK